MRVDVEQADRRKDVRDAARSWRRRGAIRPETLQAILVLYPDDRSRVRPAFRVLFFLFTVVAVAAAFSIFAVNDFPVGALLFLTALGCIVLTEVQIGALRRSGAGAEEATAILGFGFSIAAAAWTFPEGGGVFPWRLLCVAGAVLAATAAWRWGIPVFGALSAACLFLAMGDAPAARIAWMVTGLTLAPPLVVASTAARLAPSQRRAADWALVVVLAAIYLAFHLGSYDTWLLERGLGFSSPQPSSSDFGRWGRSWFVAATAIVPLIVLAAGVRWRRPLLVRMGLVLGVVSLVTLRFYVHIAPLWVVLSLCGALAMAAALLLHRFVESGSGGERAGFTSRLVFGGEPRARAIEVGLAAALEPAASQVPGESGFKGGGGTFGGGGATGSF